jgi:tetratricopeptide (TPR) repeat protein
VTCRGRGATFADVRADALALALAAALVCSTARAEPEPAGADDRRAEALLNEGITLYQEKAWEAALARFLESRRLHPTRNATRNAAYCLGKLGRLGEALDLYEALLHEFPSLPKDLEEEARAEIARLRPLVGEIEVDEAELGASIAIDGVDRGLATAAPKPLRVTAGNRYLQVTKDEFEPFEARVEVKSGETVLVVAHLRPVIKGKARGHFEKGVELLDKQAWEPALAEFLEARRLYPTPGVVLDAAVCAKNLGRHVLALELYESLLRDFPGIAADRKAQAQREIVALRKLVYTVEIDGAEPGSTVILDNVHPFDFPLLAPLRLLPGHHAIRVVKQGFSPYVRDLDAVAGQSIRVYAKLTPNGTPSKDAAKPSAQGVTLELDGSFLVSPSFEPDGGSCVASGCSGSPGFGGMALARGGYRLESLGFGIAGGYLGAASPDERHQALTKGGSPLVITDALGFDGGVVGAWIGYASAGRYRGHVRFGAGGVFGSASDDRRVASGPAASVATGASFIYLDPEARFGIRFGERFEISVGLDVMVLFGAHRPRWDATRQVQAGRAGAVAFGADPLLPGTLALIAPGLGARYEL